MDALVWLSLGLQLAALCSIVGALLLYLLRKVRVAEVLPVESAKTVLITSVDSALGLQIATYLSGRGWRVIAGCRAGGLGARLADSWLQAHVAATPENEPPPRLVTLQLDVAREDLLDEAARATAQHLPAGEHGIWAVINTAGSSGRGGAACWEGALKGNVLGALRVARTFSPLLAAAAADHPHAGRLFYIGLSSDTACESLARPEAGDAAETCAGAAAARWGTWGAARALRAGLKAKKLHVVMLHAPDLSAAEIYAPPAQLQPPSQPVRYGRVGSDDEATHVTKHAPDLSAAEIYAPPAQLQSPSQPVRYGRVGSDDEATHVTNHAPDLSAAEIYAPPAQLQPPSQPVNRPETPSSEVSGSTASCAVTMPGEAAEYSAKVLPTSALKVLEDALTAPSPKDAYYLKVKQDSWFTRMPSLRVAQM